MTGTNLYCLVTEARVCEKLAHGCYLTPNMSRGIYMCRGAIPETSSKLVAGGGRRVYDRVAAALMTDHTGVVGCTSPPNQQSPTAR